MNKFLSASLLFFALVIPTFQALQNSNESIVGGYQKIQFDTLDDLNQLDSFSEANDLCRKAYKNKWGASMGKINQVYQQIVAGINYKIVYQTLCGEVYFIIFSQSWTNTLEIVDAGNY